MAVRTDAIPVRDATLALIGARGVTVPRYDRSRLVPRIAHIGVGGFHRAHMALYTDELAAAGDWGIGGIGLLPGDGRMATALGAQDHLYTLIERGGGAPTARVVGSIVAYTMVADDPTAAVELLADPTVAIVSLTITEAGYAEGSATFDVLASALEQRRGRGHSPVTIVSCDNLPGNGDAAHAATLAATARASAPGLEAWTEQHCRFPNSMVDRITPVTSEDDRAWLHDELGIDDRWPVVAEPFRQWVIEDDFAAGRPSWEDVGVLFTDRVYDWELYKLRLLNAGHSAMAYLAALAGITFVDEALARPEVRRFLSELLSGEALPSLEEIPGYPREDYVASTLERFANTGIRDQIARLCLDGTAKFPTFLVPTVVHQLRNDGPVERAATALAGWALYLATVPVAEQAFDASGAIARRHALRAVHSPVRFLDFAEVFPPVVRDNERFRSTFVTAWGRIAEDGPLAAMGA